MKMIVYLFECNACGQRFPLMPYYPAAAPHGPNKDCTAPLGWKRAVERISPGMKRSRIG